MRPLAGSYPEYYNTYISLVAENTIAEALMKNEGEVLAMLRSINEEKGNYAYASGKWSIKELFVHLIDTERIFCYRALSFARRDDQTLPSFEHDDFVKNSKANNRTMSSILEEFESVRRASITLFKSFDETDLHHLGNIPSGKISVAAIGFAICGHYAHHMNVIRQRYS